MDRTSARKSASLVCLPSAYSVRRYEAVCRFLRSRKPIIEKDTPATTAPRPHHDTLIDEIEIERESLTWPELMTAGGFAGVTAWFVRDQDVHMLALIIDR